LIDAIIGVLSNKEIRHLIVTRLSYLGGGMGRQNGRRGRRKRRRGGGGFVPRTARAPRK